MKPILGGVPTKAQKKTPPPFLGVMVQESCSPQPSCTESFDLGGEDIQPLEDPECTSGMEGQGSQQLQAAPVTIHATVPVTADKPSQSAEGATGTSVITAGKTSQSAEGATGTSVIMAPAPGSHLPAPELREEGMYFLRALSSVFQRCIPRGR